MVYVRNDLHILITIYFVTEKKLQYVEMLNNP
jgi:hypothetical protein